MNVKLICLSFFTGDEVLDWPWKNNRQTWNLNWPEDEITIKEEDDLNSNSGNLSSSSLLFLPSLLSSIGAVASTSSSSMHPSQQPLSSLNARGTLTGSSSNVTTESGLSYRLCPICQKRITYNHLKRHIRTQHTNMDRAQCPFCARVLKNTYSLETHIANYHK